MKGFILFGIAYLKHANLNCHLVCVSGSLRRTRNLDKDDLKYADEAKQFAYVQQLELYLCRERLSFTFIINELQNMMNVSTIV